MRVTLRNRLAIRQISPALEAELDQLCKIIAETFTAEHTADGVHNFTVASGISQLHGDVAAGPGTGNQLATLAATGVVAGSYGSVRHTLTMVVDAKGRLLALSQAIISDGEVDDGNSGAAITLDLSLAKTHILKLTANCTITLSNGVNGNTYRLILVQDATGGRTVSVNGVSWSGGTPPTLVTTANKAAVLTLLKTGAGAGGYFGLASVDNLTLP